MSRRSLCARVGCRLSQKCPERATGRHFPGAPRDQDAGVMRESLTILVLRECSNDRSRYRRMGGAARLLAVPPGRRSAGDPGDQLRLDSNACGKPVRRLVHFHPLGWRAITFSDAIAARTFPGACHKTRWRGGSVTSIGILCPSQRKLMQKCCTFLKVCRKSCGRLLPRLTPPSL